MINIINKKTLIIIIIIIIIITLLAGGLMVLSIYKNKQPSTSAPDNSTFETYQNEEWGFEFQYPKEWSFHENTFYSPFSKFNLAGASPEENGRPDPLAPSLLINIVTPDFADYSFYDLRNIASEIIVGGVKGLKYEYEYEKSPKIAIILPFGQYKTIFGAYKIYENTLNQILASFKFLK